MDVGLTANIGIASYATAAVLFVLLVVLLLTSWRGRLHGGLLVLAVATSAVWAMSAAYFAFTGGAALAERSYYAIEVLRNAAWFAFLFHLLAPLEGAREPHTSALRYARPLVYGFAALVLFADVAPSMLAIGVPIEVGVDFRIAGHLALAVVGLALIEQLFRNTRPDRRWAVKYLFLGIGVMFAYDLFMYAHALLFKQVAWGLWQPRGFVNALIVPMLAVSAARNPEWSLDVFVSRKMVFHAASLFGAGTYLLAMAAAGYYIRVYGGDWGATAQATFLFLAITLLLVLLFSGQMRARAKVFLSKHFFNYKYDYREEWLKLSRTLTSNETGGDMRERVIRALADIVDSPGGMLWTRAESGHFTYSTHWNMNEPVADNVKGDAPLVSFMTERQWIINLREYESQPEDYGSLELPDWLKGMERAWLIVPLIQQEELLAFVVLSNPRAPRSINWEDRDLLKTVGLQLASYVALLETSLALMNARQFEAFNRFSSYVVHDLKNVIAQLALVVSNAEKHMGKPAFMEDAIRTVENATNRMTRMLAQLRKGRRDDGGKEIVALGDVLRDAVALSASRQPSVAMQVGAEPVLLLTERDQLRDVIAHIIQNAQDATPDAGTVVVRAYNKGVDAVIEIEDTGCGMEPQFLRERLFRPFDTTKGNAGMGIGVFESREFVWAQGGDMQVKSEYGVGTTFQIILPLYRDAPEQQKESNMARLAQ